MKLAVLALFVLAFAIPAFPEIVKQQGTGEAIVGSDQSQEHAEELAFLKAKSDATNKIGSYVESNIVTEKSENGKALSEITHSTLRGFTGGMVKLVEGTKSVVKDFKDSAHQVLSVKVIAQFQVDDDEYKKAIESFAKGTQEKEDLKSKIEAFNRADKELTEISATEQMDDGKVTSVLSDYKRTQDDVSNAIVRLNGGAVIISFTKKKDERIENIKTYLTNFSKVGGPNTIWNARIKGEPKIEEVGENTVKVTVEVDVDENKNVMAILRENYKSYEKYLYRDGQIDYVTKKIVPAYINFPLALSFMDSDNRTIAFSIQKEGGGVYPSILGGFLSLRKEYENGQRGASGGKLAKYGLPYRSETLKVKLFETVIPKNVMDKTTSIRVLFISPAIGREDDYSEEYGYSNYYQPGSEYTSYKNGDADSYCINFYARPTSLNPEASKLTFQNMMTKIIEGLDTNRNPESQSSSNGQ